MNFYQEYLYVNVNVKPAEHHLKLCLWVWELIDTDLLTIERTE